MSVRALIWIGFLSVLSFNDVNCLISSTEAVQTITLDECRRMMAENSSLIADIEQTKPKTKCETNGCVRVAAQILDYIDESLDLCENFYQFANGRFLNDKTNETDHYDSQSLYSTVTELVNKKVGPLLSESIQPNEWGPFQLAKNFYESCLNQDVIVRRGNEELIDIVDGLGGFPAAKGNKWSSRKFDLVQLIKKMKELGFETNIIFDVSVNVNLKNTTHRVLQISGGSYEIDEDSRKYRQRMFQKAGIFTDKKDAKAKARISKEMEKVWAFEKSLSELSSASDDDDDEVEEENDTPESDTTEYETTEYDTTEYDTTEGDTTESYTTESNTTDNDTTESDTSDSYITTESDNDSHNEDDSDDDDEDIPFFSIKELQESYPYLNWLDYINALLPSGVDVSEDEQIVNGDLQFFKKLATLMEATSNRTIANYIVWRAIYSAYKLQIFETGKVRREECIKLTSKLFPIPVGILYSRKYFKESSKEAVVIMVEDIRRAFIGILSEVEWMDEETRQKAIAKAENMIPHVGYPNELYENGELEEYYADLEMDSYDFFKNNLQWRLFNSNQQFKSLRQPVNRSEWKELLELDPTVANAFYAPTKNQMQFPIAILHELFFSTDKPQYINYASLGNTVGHEITHGFDSSGRLFDLYGNLINWWNPDAKRRFKKETNCFVEQYNQYTDPRTNLTVDGDNTLNENMADNGGTRAAYLAYLNWIKRNGDERLVPGLKYNQKQLFWIAYAQAESSVFGKGSLTYIIENDEHAPNEFRVNGVVSNLQEFANDFNCPVGSKMNPVKKCRVW